MPSISGSPPVTLSEPIEVLTTHGVLLFRHAFDGVSDGVVVQSRVLDTDQPLLVRVQSSCVFSEALKAIDCDCATQLDQSLGLISDSLGLVIYVYEEGRGVGLPSKFDAIALQQREGIDTAEAFDRLGLHTDPRAHKFAGTIINDLIGSSPVVLLTNNPHKMRALIDCGVNVVSRRALLPVEGSPADSYLRAKACVLGHKLSED